MCDNIQYKRLVEGQKNDTLCVGEFQFDVPDHTIWKECTNIQRNFQSSSDHGYTIDIKCNNVSKDDAELFFNILQTSNIPDNLSRETLMLIYILFDNLGHKKLMTILKNRITDSI
jgi:hypothetical protein